MFEQGGVVVDGVAESAVEVAFARIVAGWWLSGGGDAVGTFPVEAPAPAPVHELLPGPVLAARLAGGEVSGGTDEEVVDRIVAWQRLVSWATAAQAGDVAELLARRRGSREAEFAVDEIAAALTTTRAVAARTVELAVGLQTHPTVGDALAAGRICERRARVLVDAAPTVPLDERVALVAALVSEAQSLTAPRLRDRARRAEIEHDPAAAQARREGEKRRRGVFYEPLPDAMARISAYLPAEDAQALYRTVDDLARTLPADARSTDQRRADALVDQVCGTPTYDADHRPDSPGTAVETCTTDSCTADVCAGHTGAPATSTGHRPGSGGRRGAGSRGRARVLVTVPFTTLAGLEDLPGEIAGYGPVPADVARQIAANATWTRLLTDPADGRLLDAGTRTYRLARPLRAAVEARDITCCFPGCRVPADRCDLDHIDPYEPDTATGTEPQTRASNLQALCRHHHRLKTHGEWTVTTRPDGTTTWTAPTGHTYDRPPERYDHPPHPDGPPPDQPGQPPERAAEPPDPEPPPPF
ncbi:HNH endonuclease signature motif containing protein [Cellulomonas sp. PhB143]|uniref:HNH endonuclease signature motif containing protein n=1 Tax=Cellulomonas sp. PhB143 TaxID=2485186 RepID=UPI000F46A21F|nr:HNH endonuclease signature motif containing protein [Cellulomonas sp. PhB143]ROS72124.1 uncharacterized protein DUF222 [Cellulomonas sp. PhB143]